MLLARAVGRGGKLRLQGRGPLNAVRHCGLVATLDYDDSGRASDEVVRRAISQVEHRGPDGQYTLASSPASSIKWAMAHSRLAIVAPEEEAANQPFDLLEGRLACVANGEIYTHRELWSELEAGGHNAKRASQSDCEVIAHLYSTRGAAETARLLTDAGMFATVVVDSSPEEPRVFAARDPTGIKPLYYALDSEGRVVAFASELKALLEVPGLAEVKEFPAGHYYDSVETPNKPVRYYRPEWAAKSFSTTKVHESNESESVIQDRVRDSLDKAVVKRMMSDVEFGLLLSGGVDSCIVGQLMAHRCRTDLNVDSPPSYTVGMRDSPDVMAARAMAEVLGTRHHERIFTADEAIKVVEEVVRHMETYNAELIRSAIPNWFLAELAGDTSHGGVKMVLTGEGADELWAGYAYFADAPTADHVHRELVRIYGRLGVANLLRTDRMSMAHGLEARVPFLDVGHTRTVMELDPSLKLPQPRASGGKNFEKAFLRRCFERPHGGMTIPPDLLWRPKAMQCEGVGEDWVAILQAALAARVSDADFASRDARFPHETPHSKEEYFYRRIFEENFPNCELVPTPWEGGCRAAGAEWGSDTYTRHGRENISDLTHAYQAKASL